MLPLIVLAIAAASIWYGVRTFVQRAWEQREIAALKADPGDYVRYEALQAAPELVKLSVATRTAIDTRDHRASELQSVTEQLPRGVKPTQTYAVTIFGLAFLWLLGLVCVIYIDGEAFSTVMNSTVFGYLSAIVFVTIPLAVSLSLHHAWERYRAGELTGTQFVAIAAGAAMALAVVCAVLVWVAPMRAEAEFSAELEQAAYAQTEAALDGDTDLVDFFQSRIAALHQEKAKSAQFNAALMPLAALTEFGAGLALAGALRLARYYSLRHSLTGDEATVKGRQQKERLADASRTQRISRRCLDAGVTQQELMAAMAQMHAGREVSPGAPSPATAPAPLPLAPAEAAPPSSHESRPLTPPSLPKQSEPRGRTRNTPPATAAVGSQRRPAAEGGVATATARSAPTLAQPMDPDFDIS